MEKDSFSKKVLIIGNSFSLDATYYLRDIIKAYVACADVSFKIGVLYHGSSYAKRQWEAIEKKENDYFEYYENNVNKGYVGVEEILAKEKWDMVILQHFTALFNLMTDYDNGSEYAFEPYLNLIAEYVIGICPFAEICLHQTWSYEIGFDICKTRIEQEQMAENSKRMNENAAKDIEAYIYGRKDTAEQKHSVIRVIPSGEVMQYARGYIDQSGHKIFQTQFNKADISTDLDILNTSDIDIIKNRVKLNRDGFHASMLGRYMLALVWFRMLFGITVTGNRFMPGNEENVLSMGYDKTGAVKNIHMSFEKIPENYFCLVQKIVDEYFSKESSLIDYK